jgi:hypothetical protein
MLHPGGGVKRKPRNDGVVCLTPPGPPPTIFAMLRLVMGVFSLSCASPPQEGADLAERLKDPANVWPAFQDFIRDGLYSRAYDLVAPGTRKSLSYEIFYITFASFEAPRRLVAKLEVHAAEPGKIRLCSAEFGASRDLQLAKYLNRIWTLAFTPEDIEFFKGRTLDWYRHQVRRADGWHFAYPPDWTYAPLGRTCGCGIRK